MPDPEDEWMLARGEMISRWPIRTGVLVVDGTAYFGAGLFPHEEVYLYGVNASDGRIVWRRDNISHDDASHNDLSPQGHLLPATDELLIVPSGRSLPAVIDRRTGKLLHSASMVGARPWSAAPEALLADGQIYSSGQHHILAMEQKTGDAGFGYFDGRQMAVAGDAAYVTNGIKLSRLDRTAYAAWSRKRHAMDAKINAETKVARDSGPMGDEAKGAVEILAHPARSARPGRHRLVGARGQRMVLDRRRRFGAGGRIRCSNGLRRCHGPSNLVGSGRGQGARPGRGRRTVVRQHNRRTDRLLRRQKVPSPPRRRLQRLPSRFQG